MLLMPRLSLTPPVPAGSLMLFFLRMALSISERLRGRRLPTEEEAWMQEWHED